MLATLKTRFIAVANRLNAPDQYRTFNLTARHNGSCHCEFINGTYHYICTERGREFRHRTTKDQNEVLYWLVSTMTRQMASKFELDQRPKDRRVTHDTRLVWMDKDVELLSIIDPDWANITRQEYDKALTEHPHQARPHD